MSTSALVLRTRLLLKARFRHLQALAMLFELGSVQRAASAMGLTQPAVTRLLADLEGWLATPLFHRHARGVLPTDVCRDLMPMVRQSLRGIDAAAEAVADRSALGEGVVRVGASTAAINGLLLQALPDFHGRHPGIQVQLRESEWADQLAAVGRQELDLGLGRQSSVPPQGWRFEPLQADTFAVVCSPKHPLALKRRLRWPDLQDQVWLVPPVDALARHRLEALAQEHGLRMTVSPLITRVSAMTWAMLQQQELLTLVPASVLAHACASGALVALKLPQPLPYEPLGLLLPETEVSGASGRMADFLRAWSRSRDHH
jgi:DNA-binding transcriptional LysR family regulator